MSAVPQTRLLTAEEFARLPQPEDGSQQELVQGVVITLPPPSFYHGLCCNELGSRLGKHVQEQKLGYVTSNNSGVILARGRTRCVGRISPFGSRQRMPEPLRTGYPDIAPDLVVEVLSPSDVFPRILRKVQQYLRAGTSEVWIVVPEDWSVTVCRPGQEQVILSNGETLSGGDVLPGFSCPVAELFP